MDHCELTGRPEDKETPTKLETVVVDRINERRWRETRKDTGEAVQRHRCKSPKNLVRLVRQVRPCAASAKAGHCRPPPYESTRTSRISQVIVKRVSCPECSSNKFDSFPNPLYASSHLVEVVEIKLINLHLIPRFLPPLGPAPRCATLDPSSGRQCPTRITSSRIMKVKLRSNCNLHLLAATQNFGESSCTPSRHF